MFTAAALRGTIGGEDGPSCAPPLKTNAPESDIAGRTRDGRSFGTARQAALKRSHYSPAQVTPLILSAGGAISKEDDALLPCPGDRNGRHWTRMELSKILLKYRCTLAWQIWWSRRGPVVQQAAA